MDTIANQNARKTVFQLAENLGFYEYDVDMGDDLQSGYLGEVCKVKISGKRDGKEECLRVVVKYLPHTELMEFLEIYKAYNLEVKMYSETFALFDRIQEKNGVTQQFKHIKYYSSNLERAKESLIMEDVSAKGYVISKIGKALDLTHTTATLKELAKFHAMSFALKDTQPVKFKEITDDIKEQFFKFDSPKKINETIVDSIEHAAEILDNTDHAKALRAFKEQAINTCIQSIDRESAGNHGVMLHGDLWTNNILFKYDQDCNLQDALILDWQTVRVHSPVLDVLFFLLTSVSDEAMAPNFQQLMKTYYNTLADMIREMNCDPQKLYSHKVFREDIGRFAKLSLVNSLMMLPIFANDRCYIDNANNNHIVKDAKQILGTTYRSELYINRIRSIVKFYLDNNLL